MTEKPAPGDVLSGSSPRTHAGPRRRAAAICWTPQSWIDGWNARYRDTLARIQAALQHINAAAGFDAFTIADPEGGWYLPLRVSPRLIPQASSGGDAYAVLLHYGGDAHDSGIALLPGELFGYGVRAQGRPAGANRPNELMLRGTLAADERDLDRFVARLKDATTALLGEDGPEIVQAALKRARQVADVDGILASRRCRTRVAPSAAQPRSIVCRP